MTLARLSLFLLALPGAVSAAEPAANHRIAKLIREACASCHEGPEPAGALDVTKLPLNLADRGVYRQWVEIHGRVERGEMPPDDAPLADRDRQTLLAELGDRLTAADRADVKTHGRGPLRRLNREEYEQNLRDLLRLPELDIRDMLPQDRVANGFNKTTAALDISRVQLAAYLDAADAALRQAMADGPQPPPQIQYRAVGRKLFSSESTFGEREAMFFARDGRAISREQLAAAPEDPAIELALFRSAHWPYYGYPQGLVAKHGGTYRVRFSARAVLQIADYRIKPATRPVPMTFRARKPSGPDVSGDVRATGGIRDVGPKPTVFETTIRLLPGETFEYSLLGLPVPLARNVNGGPPTYRYPPFPKEGQPGVAFQWLEVSGPLPPESWPAPSHRVLFDGLGAEVPEPDAAAQEASRLLHRFIAQAAREPVASATIARYEKLVLRRLEQQVAFRDALLAGYQAFLCSSTFLYLRDPSDPAERPRQQYAIASRLSHFLSNSRPDPQLLALAEAGSLRDRDVLLGEVERLIASDAFPRFVQNFTDYWLSLRELQRDEPDYRLYPEYRFDNYLVESLRRETQAFFTAMIRDNLPARVLIDSDFAFVNDRLAEHYGLPSETGSRIRRVSLPADSPYGGLLTQGAVLKVTANGTSTSPIVRGAWIMERLLGQPPPPPPAAVPAVEPDIRGAKTIRQLLAQHTESASCASCHARFDPVGLALENFDVLGGWRTRYRGLEHGQPVRGIDRAGHDFQYTLADPVSADGRLLDGRTFNDIRELKSLLAADSRQLARNLLHQFTVYATGTPVRFADRAEIERILDGCADDDYRVRDLLQALVRSEIFLGPSEAVSR